MTNLRKEEHNAKSKCLNINGQKVGEIELADAVFGVEVNEHVVYEVVKNQLANKRQGTQSAKTRAEVRGGGRKPWKQKGTGRARQGSIRAPTMDRWWSCIRTKAKRLQLHITKESKKISYEICFNIKSTKRRNDSFRCFKYGSS